MIDPTSASSKSSPRSFFQKALFVFIPLLILILCLLGWYFLSQSDETSNQVSGAQFELIGSTPEKVLVTNEPVSLFAPEIAPITTEEEVDESHAQNRLELTEKAIDALSKHKANSSSSTQ